MKNTWTKLSDMTTARKDLTIKVVNNKLFCIGGTNGSSPLGKVEIMDIKTKEWSTGIDMTTPRSELASVVVGDKIYCIGGLTASGITNKVEIYNTASNTWENGVSMPTARAGIIAELVGNMIYVIGGKNATSAIQTVEVFNLETNEWTTKANMPTARYEMSSMVKDKEIFCAAGKSADYSNKLEIYNTETNEWRTGTDIPASEGDFCNIYDVDKNAWSTGATMLVPRSNFAFFNNNGKVLCVGGQTDVGISTEVDFYDTGKIYNKGESSMNILTNLNLNLNQLLNARFETVASLPANGVSGQFVFNAEDNKFYGYNGTAWIDLSNISGFTPEEQAKLNKVIADLAKEITDRTEADTALDTKITTNTEAIATANAEIAKKASTEFVNTELAKKAEKVHTHVVADITDIGTAAKLDATKVAQLDDNNKIKSENLPSITINQTFTVNTTEEAMALTVEVGDIVIVNPTTALKAIPLALNEEFQGYLAQGQMTYLTVNIAGETFEAKFRPLQSSADSISKAEIDALLAKKADKTQVATDIATAKTEAVAEAKALVDAVQADLNATEARIDGELTTIKENATALSGKIDTHEADAVKHITAEERNKWNASSTKKTKHTEEVVVVGANFKKKITHGIEGFVSVNVYDSTTKELVFVDVKSINGENAIEVGFGSEPTNKNYTVVVIG